MISICLTTYNSERFLRPQLESILSQLRAGDEIVVSDDGSTDSTLSIVEEYREASAGIDIRVCRNEGEHGYTANFENALRQARGDIIFLSDHDDVWAPTKVERSLKLLADADFLVHDATIIDENGRQTAPSFYALRHPRRTFLGNLVKFGYLGCCMAFRRCVLQRALPFPSNHRMCTHDNWLALVGMGYYRAVVSDERLIGYRRHSANYSPGAKNAHNKVGFRLCFRTYLLWHLATRIWPRR